MDNTYIADIHSHILPGVDDGAGDPETSAKLLSKAYEEGTRILFFTPHYQRGRNKYKPQDLDALYNAIAKVIGSRWPDMKLCLGNEVYYEPGIKEDLKAGLIHTMAGTRYVLVEFSRNTSVKNVFRAVREVTADGHKMIVAHVERYPALVEDRESMEKLKDMGVLFQMNAEALRKKGFFAGKELKGNEGLVSQGLISFIGADSHSVDLRPPEIAFAADRIRKLNPEMADRIIFGNARDLVNGKIL